MKRFYKTYGTLVLLLLSQIAFAQIQLTNNGAEVFISKGTKLYIKGNLTNNDSTFYNLGSISIEGSITNNAFHLFSDENHGIVTLKGNQNQTIGGSGSEIYFHVLHNQTSDTLILELPIHIFDSLSLENGYILLNSNTIHLDNSSTNATGFLYGESDSVRVIGDSGSIDVSYIAFQPVNKNIAGIGLILNSSTNFGNTTIKRFHQQQQITDGSINKVYAFDFANTGTSNVHITYMDAEFNADSLTENDFSIWKSTDFGSTFTDLNGNVDTINNFVDIFGISMDDSWLTIAPINCKSTPYVNIGSDTTYLCPGDSALLIAGDHSNNYSFYWFDSSTDSIYKPTQEGLVWVRVTNPRGCFSFDSTYVKFNSLPKANFLTNNICNKDSAIFTNQSSIPVGNIVSYTWTFGNNDTSYLANPKEQYTIAGNYLVKLICESDSGCVYDTSQNITIYPLPKPDFYYTATCGGSIVHFHDTTTIANPFGIISRYWNFGNGASSTTSLDTIITYSVQGNYLVKLIAQSNAGCIDSIEQNLIINSTDTASFTTTTNCLGDSTVFTNTSSYTETDLTYKYLFDDSDSALIENPKHLFDFTGTHNTTMIVYYNNGLCTDTATNTNSVLTSPYINFGDTIEACDSYTLDAQNSGCTYLWNDGSTGQTHNVTSSGYYSVAITNASPCTYFDSVYVKINPSPSPNLGIDTSVCSQYLLDAGYSGNSYSWNTGQSTQSISINSSGLYIVTVTDSHSCSGYDSININILPLPQAQFTVSNVCLGQQSIFNESSSISSGSISNYNWDFGDANTSTIQNPSHTFTSDASYSIKLKVTSSYGCVDSISHTTDIKSLPKTGFTSSYQCDKQAISFVDTSTIKAPFTISSYKWEFDDGSISMLQNPTNNYTSPGNYNVKLICTSSFGCKDSTVTAINVNPRDSLAFSASDECLNDSTDFVNNSTYSVQNTIWNWSFGDNNITTQYSPKHLYSNDGVYNARLIVNYNNGQCYDTLIKTVTIYANPYINFGDTIQTCGLQLVLNAQNSGCNYLWNDNSSSQQKTVTSNGDYWVIITNSHLCSFKDSVYAILNSPSVPNLGPDTSVCESIQLDAGYVGSTYIWNTNDSTQTITVSSNGLYKVTVTDANGCTGSDSINILINPSPTAAFSIQNTCLNEPNYFQNQSTISSGNIISYLYDFGDNSTSNSANSNHIFASIGNYQVSLTIISDSGCVSDTTIIHTVNEVPKAGFTSSSLCDNFEVNYIDTSTISNAYSITSHQWSFSNNLSSTAQDTSILFSSTGSYTATLIVSSNMGCSDTASSTHTVIQNDSAYFYNGNTCLGDTIYFNNQSTLQGSVQWFWVFGNGDTAVTSNGQVFYSTPGQYQVKLYATYNNNQCNTVYKKIINVNTPPQIGFSDTTETCSPNYILDANNTGSQYLWSNFSNNQTINVNTSGIYYVQVTDTNNCQNSDTTLMLFHPSPQPYLGADTVFCTNYTLDAGSGAFYNWNTGDTTQYLPISQTGIYSVKVTTLYGCEGTDTISLQIMPPPIINLGADIDTCNVDSLLLSAGNFSSYLWNNNNTSNSIYASQNGLYWVTITDTNNCSATDSINISYRYLHNINFSDTLFLCSGDSSYVNPNASGATVNWWGPNGFSQTADSVLLSDVGTYYLEATVLSCVDRDTFELSLSKMSMHPRFLAASDVLTLDSVKFIELSYPNPIHYKWDFKDGTNDTIADPVHIFYLEGTYDVMLIAANSECQAKISKLIIVTSVPRWNNDIPVDSLKNKPNSPKFTEILSSNLFPNPNNGQFTLKVELTHKTNIQIAVFDLTGRIIYLKDYSNKELINERFNFNSLRQGYYFLSIKTINETKTFKISVVR